MCGDLNSVGFESCWEIIFAKKLLDGFVVFISRFMISLNTMCLHLMKRACDLVSGFGGIGSAPLANGLNILHTVLAQDISICYVLAVGLYMVTFDGRFADDAVGGSR